MARISMLGKWIILLTKLSGTQLAFGLIGLGSKGRDLGNFFLEDNNLFQLNTFFLKILKNCKPGPTKWLVDRGIGLGRVSSEWDLEASWASLWVVCPISILRSLKLFFSSYQDWKASKAQKDHWSLDHPMKIFSKSLLSCHGNTKWSTLPSATLLTMSILPTSEANCVPERVTIGVSGLFNWISIHTLAKFSLTTTLVVVSILIARPTSCQQPWELLWRM